MVAENKNMAGLIHETMPSALTTLQLHVNQHNPTMKRVNLH